MTISNNLKFTRDGAQPSVRIRLHSWVTVINPTNHRLLLQACDDCGVVKSENSVIRSCKADRGLGLISRSQQLGHGLAV
ncbi:MAG: hypothetical protein ACI9FR_001334 [Cryomorphaceae bacterium]|jgi:hypothetical protein